MKYAYSFDGENYDSGEFDSIHEAALAGMGGTYHGKIYVGEIRAPIQPEHCVDAEDLLERTEGNDDYMSDWGDWRTESKEQRAELTEAIRKVYSEWLDRHDLRPTHFVVDNAREYTWQEIEAMANNQPSVPL